MSGDPIEVVDHHIAGHQESTAGRYWKWGIYKVYIDYILIILYYLIDSPILYTC
jgi:hypothetical protein